jgi:hypothetical protein
MEFLNDLWFDITYRVRRAFYFSFKRFKWFLGIKEPPLISVEVQQMPSEILGGMKGMLFIQWQRERRRPEAFQLQDFELDHLLKSSKKQTFQTLPADVEKVLKEKYGGKNV